jgi:translation elongation factor P/translation initiation factor 5A
MQDETFEQISVELSSALPDPKQHPFISDGVQVTLLSYNDSPISLELPNKVEIGEEEGWSEATTAYPNPS